MTPVPTPRVRQLAYVGFAVQDPEAWVRFGTDVLGFMPAHPADGARRLRIDERHWRIAVEPGTHDDLSFIGLEVATDAELDALAARLASAGVAVMDGAGGLAADRGVSRLLHCTDPLGIRVEIVCGSSRRHEHPFVSAQGVSGFVTGDQGLGHVVLGTDDMAAMRAFYVDGLGFRLSDRIRMTVGGTPVQLEFFHCNPRHHTLALVPLQRPRRIFHFMVQARSVNDVGFALDRAMAAGSPITSTLGRHTNDHMLSFYVGAPGGIEVEFGCGARTVDDATWSVELHHKPSLWGHLRR
jgi:2,3-dihydroxybiphenyl 1,2-dioxygenase